MKENIIKLTESDLKSKILEVAKRILKEHDPDEDYYDYDEPASASDDFYNSGCDAELNNRYPNIDFEFDIENDGTVTALDLNTGKYYIGNGVIEHETVGLGYPSPFDYDSEAEGEVAYYDFYNCLQTIMKKIDNDQPDGVEDGYIETSEEEISNAISESIKQINEKLYGPSPMNVKELGRNNQTLLPAIQSIIEFCEAAASTPQAHADMNVKKFYTKLTKDLQDMRINAFESF